MIFVDLSETTDHHAHCLLRISPTTVHPVEVILKVVEG